MWFTGKESTCKVEDASLIPELGRSHGGGNGNPPQYSCLGNSMDRGAWQAIYTWTFRVRHDLETEHTCMFNLVPGTTEANQTSHTHRISYLGPF